MKLSYENMGFNKFIQKTFIGHLLCIGLVLITGLTHPNKGKDYADILNYFCPQKASSVFCQTCINDEDSNNLHLLDLF